MRPGERENQAARRSPKGHYEVWYLTLVDPGQGIGAWIRHTREFPVPGSGRQPEAGLWFAVFDAARPASNLAVQSFHPIDALRIEDDPFRLELAGAELVHGGARGAFGDVAWDLAWPATRPAFRHFPRILYRGPFPRTKVLAPCHAAPFSGWIRAGDRRIDLAGAPGQQSHLWGTRHAHRWAWAHAGAFDGSPGTVFEGLTGQVKVGPVTLPYLSVASLEHEGETYAFNLLSSIATNRGAIGPGPAWRFEGRSRRARLVAELSCREQDLVLVEYHDPDATRVPCRNTEVATARLLLERPGHPPLSLNSAAAFEIGGDGDGSLQPTSPTSNPPPA